MEGGQRPNGLRRPTVMAAHSMYLLAIVGGWVVSVAFLFAKGTEWMLSREGLLVQSAVLEPICFLLPTVVYASRRRDLGPALRLNPPSFKMMAFGTLAGPLMALFGTVLGSLWALLLQAVGGHPVGTEALIPGDPSKLLDMVLPVVILPGICEELLFRGTILSAWERRGAWPAIMASGLMFAALHPFDGLPVYVLAGLALGYVAVASNSLYVSMAMHSTYNIATLIIAMLATQQQSAGLELTGTTPDPSYAVLSLAVVALVLGALFFGSMIPFVEAMHSRRLAAPTSERESLKMGRRGLVVFALAIAVAGVQYAFMMVQTFSGVGG